MRIKLPISKFPNFRFLVFIGTIVVAVTVYFIYLAPPKASSAGWWNDAWNYRKGLTINSNKVVGTHTDFPVLVSLTDTSLGAHAQADGDDIVFLAADGRRLSHEIESYASTTGTLVAWVKVPTVSTAEDTQIWMYYGNAGVGSQQEKENVWDDGYLGVWHLKETSGQHLDSTRHSYDSSAVAVAAQGTASGKINGADDLDEANGFVYFDTKMASEETLTVSLWVNQQTLQADEERWLTFEDDVFTFMHDGASSVGQLHFFVKTDGTVRSIRVNSAISAGSWYYVTGVWDGTTQTLYKNGSQAGSPNTPGGDFNVPYNEVMLGIDTNETPNAIIDEVRISNVIRSANWIQTEYNNQNAPTQFITVQAEEVGTGPVGYWSFDEGFGNTANDESGSMNHGTITGAAWQDESMCVSGKCLYFDGSGDYINHGDILDVTDTGKGITINAWVKRTNDGGGTNQTVVSKQDKDSPYKGYSVHYEGSELVFDYINTDISDAISVDSLAPQLNVLNEWIFLTVTYDGSKSANGVKMYANGVSYGTSVYLNSLSANSLENNFNFEIGGRDGANEIFDGFLDEVKVYPYARTADQVKQDYAAGSAGISAASGVSASFGAKSDSWMSDGLVGYWKFDEPVGIYDDDNGFEDAADTSGNGNTGDAAGNASTTVGKFGNGNSFGGTSDTVEIAPNSSIDNLVSTMSISFWFKTSAVQEAFGMTLNPSDGIGGISNSYGGTGRRLFFQKKASLDHLEVTTEEYAFELNTWTHVVATFSGMDADNAHIYVNGTEASYFVKDDAIGTWNTGEGLKFHAGSLPAGASTQLDEVRIYNRALSPDEVAQLYEWAPGPVAHLKFDEKEGAILHDSGIYGRHGTFTGSGVEFATTSVATDNFDRSNGGLGSDWSTVATFGDLQISSNRVAMSSGLGGSRWNASTFSPAQYSQVKLAVLPANNGGGVGVYVRADDTDETYYGCEAKIISGQGVMFMFAGINANYQDWDSQVKVVLSANDVIRLEHDGTMLRCYQNGVLRIAAADNTIADGDPGIYINSDATARLDDWEAGNLTSGNSAPFTRGKYGSALDFNGVDDVVWLGSADALSIPYSFSSCAWIYPRSVPNASEAVIVDNPSADFAFEQYSFEIEADRSIGLYWQDDSAGFSSLETSASAIQFNAWSHVCVVRETDTTGAIYLNGTALATSFYGPANNIPSSGFGPTLIGGPSKFDGLIDDLWLFNYPLTQKQIINVMNAREPGDSAIGSPVGSYALYLPFDEGYGDTAYDKSINKNNGTLTPGGSGGNTTVSAMWDKRGKFGGAMEFDGTDDYVSIGADLDIVSLPFTVSAWVNPDDYGDYGNIISKRDDWAFDSMRFQLQLSYDTGKVTFGSSDTHLIFSYSPRIGEWTHLLVIADSDSTDLYVNGGLKESLGAVNLGTDASAEVTIGRTGDLSDPFDGLIDEVRIYPFALNADEVKTLYNSGVGTVMGAKTASTTASGLSTPDWSKAKEYCVPGDSSLCRPPVGEWKMDEKTGVTAYDTSGNGNDGTLGGGTAGYRPIWKPGKVGGALKFDGADDYVAIADNSVLSLDPTNDYTWEFWMKSDDLSQEWKNVWWQGQDSNYFFQIYAHTIVGDGWYGDVTNGIIVAYVSAGNLCSGEKTIDNVLNNNQWFHIAVIYDASELAGNRLSIFVNGVDQSSGLDYSGCAPTSINPNTTWIGNNSEWEDEEFNGTIDEVRIFNYARTPAQIAWDYNRGGPVGWWKFDECSGGLINDWSMNGNNGQLILGSSGVTATGTCASSSNSFWSNGADGKRNSAGSFDGTSDYVRVNHSSVFNITGDITISGWVKRHEVSESNYVIIASKTVDASVIDYDLTITPSGETADVRNRIVFGSGALSPTYVIANTEISNDIWHHVMVVRSGSSVRFYLDGKPDGVRTMTGSISTNSYPILIGSDLYAAPSYTGGLIDDVKIWNYALTSEQVKTEYAGGAVRFE